ncbi:bifunctional ADP-dependent NAD(P)H-hydrate dehydratase/NAD(P)H-hydrate epimerase [Alteraurantiacibacter aestuarii]|uniref:NAD(P)H-hydrate dehydratase n=1 Tax=Alteraurantiacibacter aestuarii TaxID=650004 RepID=UPI0031DAB1BA
MAHNNQILTVQHMQAAEQALIDGGETVSSLMETAGKGAADWIWRLAAGRSVTVLCGPGNNGGDGYVIARVLQERGLSVAVVAPFEPRTEAAIAARKAWGGECVKDARGGVFVDCLFGSGLTRELGGKLRTLLVKLAGQHSLSVAVDLPSGIDSDSGAVLDEGLPSFHLVIALGAWKFAHWLMPAMAGMQAKRLVDIGVAKVPGAAMLSPRPQLHAPDTDEHKYSRGLLGVVGGAMPGASMLAARSAMHGGAGYVKLFTAEAISGAPDDLVTSDGDLTDLLVDPRLSALLIGPGLGRDEEARTSLATLLAWDLPTVCDADALVLLEPDMLDDRESELVVTPHAGELEALCRNFDTAEPERVDQIAELAQALNATVVAKGPDTIIASSTGSLAIMPPATSWLSTAGTGDVLAGLIASRLAAGQAGFLAAQEGAWLHGCAAHHAGPAFSSSDLIDYIPKAYSTFL